MNCARYKCFVFSSFDCLSVRMGWKGGGQMFTFCGGRKTISLQLLPSLYLTAVLLSCLFELHLIIHELSLFLYPTALLFILGALEPLRSSSFESG